MGGEGRFVGELLEGGAEEGFRLRKLLAGDEDVGDAGVGGGGFGVDCEDAAVGFFGGFGFASLIGEGGGEERVVRGLRRELEGFEEVVGGFCSVSGAVDLGEGAPGTGFGDWADVAGVEGGGDGEFGAGVVHFSLAGEEKAERDVGLKGFGIGVEGSAIEGNGVVGVVLGVGYVAGVEEGAGIGGMGGEEGGQLVLGGFPIGLGDGGFGFGDFGGLGYGIWSRGLGESGDRDEKQDEGSSTKHGIPQLPV